MRVDASRVSELPTEVEIDMAKKRNRILGILLSHSNIYGLPCERERILKNAIGPKYSHFIICFRFVVLVLIGQRERARR